MKRETLNILTEDELLDAVYDWSVKKGFMDGTESCIFSLFRNGNVIGYVADLEAPVMAASGSSSSEDPEPDFT